METTIIELDRNCPKCGHPLATDGRHEWCGREDRPHVRACDHGIAELVPLGASREAR